MTNPRVRPQGSAGSPAARLRSAGCNHAAICQQRSRHHRQRRGLRRGLTSAPAARWRSCAKGEQTVSKKSSKMQAIDEQHVSKIWAKLAPERRIDELWKLRLVRVERLRRVVLLGLGLKRRRCRRPGNTQAICQNRLFARNLSGNLP